MLCPYILAADKILCVLVEITEVSLLAASVPIGPGYSAPLAGLPSSSSGLQEPAVMTLQSKRGTGLILRWAAGGDQAEGKGPHQPQYNRHQALSSERLWSFNNSLWVV